MYAKHSDTFCTILGQTAILTYNKLMNIFSYLWTTSSDIASVHFEWLLLFLYFVHL